MANEHPDPSGNTEAFRVFAQSAEPATADLPSKLPRIIIMVAVALLIVLVGWYVGWSATH